MLALVFLMADLAGFARMPPLSDCDPGEWYFVVICKRCKTKDALFRDPSKGEARIRRTYRHRCYSCKYVADYEPEEIVRFCQPSGSVAD